MKITDEMIINYLDGELNISDKELFEEELKKNPSLQKQVRLFKEGDVMNLPPVDGVDFFVNDKILFKAEIGEINGQVAVSLKNRL